MIIIKFVIWGAGTKGKSLYDMLGAKYISAFIDEYKSNSESDYNGIPIINFSTYQKEYSDKVVIVSMRYYSEAVAKLEANDIHNYTLYETIHYNFKSTDAIKRIKSIILNTPHENNIYKFG